MNLDAKIALGIDVSETRIDLVLLKKDGNGVKLLKASSGPVPEGAIEAGHIKDAAVLSRAIRGLKSRIAVRTIPAAVSLFTEPTIMQIMDVPRDVPSNIGEFIRNQVKHFAALLGKRIALDFCGVSQVGSGASHAGRILAIATDGQRVEGLVEMYNQGGIKVDAIEPPLLACIRALYAEKIEGKYDSNVLIAVLRDDSLTLCVFRKQAVDFVRTRHIKDEKAGPEGLGKWLAGQINMIIQSYDVETPHICAPWEVTVVTDRQQLSVETQDAVIADVARSKLQLITGEDISKLGVVSQSNRFKRSCRGVKPSLTAIGLAMKLLDVNSCNLGVNLLPAEAVRLRATRKRALISANATAAVLLFMFLAISGSIWKTRAINQSVVNKKARLLQETHSVADKRIMLDGQINTISKKLKRINKILDSYTDTYWPGLLNDIAKKRPKTVCITSFSDRADSQLSLKGVAISNEGIYLFVNRLNESEHIDSASIFETKKDKNSNGLVSFEIRCFLVSRKGA